MPLKIFVMDDEESIRISLKWHLEDLGHQVITAARPHLSGMLPGHLCGQDKACGNALIIDYRMPGMNGLECIEMLLRQGCGGYASHILMISGNTGAIDMTRAREYGCTVMQKPVSLHELERWLEDVEKNLQGSLASSK